MRPASIASGATRRARERPWSVPWSLGNGSDRIEWQGGRVYLHLAALPGTTRWEAKRSSVRRFAQAILD